MRVVFTIGLVWLIVIKYADGILPPYVTVKRPKFYILFGEKIFFLQNLFG